MNRIISLFNARGPQVPQGFRQWLYNSSNTPPPLYKYLSSSKMKHQQSVSGPKPTAKFSSSKHMVVALLREVNIILIAMKKIVVEIIAALLVLLFLYASVSKLLGFKVFVDEINNQPFPNWMTPYLVVIIPGSEILISLALLFDRTRKVGLYASFVLLFLFTLYAVLVLFHVFDYVPCSCGGMLKKLNWTQHMFFTLGFLVLSVTAILLSRKKKNIAVRGQVLRT